MGEEPQQPLEVGVVMSSRLLSSLNDVMGLPALPTHATAACLHPCAPSQKKNVQFPEITAGLRSAKPCLFTVPLLPWRCTLDRLFRMSEGCHLVEEPPWPASWVSSMDAANLGAVANPERN